MAGGLADFTVSVAPAGYFLVTCTGFVTIADARVMRAELDRVSAQHPRINRSVYDGTETDGFERGQAIEWITWSRGRARPNRALGFVTNIPSAIAVSSTLRVMVPRLRFGVFGTREAAVAFVLTANDVDRPSAMSR